METNRKTLWESLWDYDPNGLVVFDNDLIVRVVNPAFCRMFGVTVEEIVGKHASVVMDDAEELIAMLKRPEGTQPHREKYYAKQDLAVRQVVFPIEDEGINACILVDHTHDFKMRREMLTRKQQTIARVQEVVDKQMKVAQEIAGLLGETTAETKVSLIKIVELVENENF